MDIQVTFEDGTTEMRAAWSPILWRGRNDGTDRCTPPDLSQILFSFAWYEAGRVAWGHACRGDTRKEHCATSVDLSTCRGIGNRHVWRITGQDAITKALTGEWVHAYVETADEQIERLARERDAEKQRAENLRVKLDSVAADGAAAAERFVAEKARAAAAEERLADLRALAVKEAAAWRGIFPNVRGCDQEARSAWDDIVDAIDGRNGT